MKVILGKIDHKHKDRLEETESIGKKWVRLGMLFGQLD